MIMIFRASFFLLLFSVVFSFPAKELHAEETDQNSSEQSPPKEKQYYIVELVLFQHLNEQGKLDEFWSRPDVFNSNQLIDSTNNTGLANQPLENTLTDDTPTLAEYDLQNRRFSPLRNGIAELSSANYKLSDSAAHLRYSKDFKLLAHFGWTQRSLSKNRALPIRITSNPYSETPMPSGELKLYVTRYLHLMIDLQSSECTYPSTKAVATAVDTAVETEVETEVETAVESDETQCTNQVYRFAQNRKMRSRELHYIDNPLYGLLVYVTPYTVTPDE
ncbi:MAG: hypothetical protein GY694_10300 [Gammaproteobacteria bacterium]|nr:hypothetical protein [Gammaproteobacteria bacterium]